MHGMSATSDTVLIVDGEPRIRSSLRAGFELNGFSVLEAENATSGLKAVTVDKPDLVILDCGLPDLEGAEVLGRIRSWSNVAVIVLSILADEHEKVRLLRMGADDYVVKPFGIAELIARGEAALRRHLRARNKEPIVKTGSLSIDLAARAVTLDGRRVQLTRKEFSLLRPLAAHAGSLVTHQQLIKEIWGETQVDIQYLRILVRKLRQKVESESRPRIIVNVSGVGYRLDLGGREPRGGRR
jgi:two-component system KDP operon response regulator KdpE